MHVMSDRVSSCISAGPSGCFESGLGSWALRVARWPGARGGGRILHRPVATLASGVARRRNDGDVSEQMGKSRWGESEAMRKREKRGRRRGQKEKTLKEEVEDPFGPRNLHSSTMMFILILLLLLLL